MNRHQIRALAKPKRREETWNAEHMVEMAMRQQQAMQPAESGTALEQLALSALTAIDHDATAAGLDKEARMAAVRRGDARRGAEEGDVEHHRHLSILQRGTNPDQGFPRNQLRYHRGSASGTFPSGAGSAVIFRFEAMRFDLNHGRHSFSTRNPKNQA
jgi:hypothetical protein